MVDVAEIGESSGSNRESRHGNSQFRAVEAMKCGGHRGCLGTGFEAEMMVNLALGLDPVRNSAEDCDY